MPDLNPPDSGGPLRRISPAAVVIAFALAMTACVLGVVVWKSLEAKATTLARGQTDIQNLAHSLAEHAAHTIRSADIAMAGMVDFLKYRDPLPERFNAHLADTVNSLPQIREIGVLDVAPGKVHVHRRNTADAKKDIDGSYAIVTVHNGNRSLVIEGMAAVLAFTHTVGEFGVVLMIGGGIPGVTKTLSISIYDQVQDFAYAQANHTALLLLGVSFLALLTIYGRGSRAYV